MPQMPDFCPSNSISPIFYRNYFFLKLGFIPCKTEQPLQGMELQKKRSTTKRLKHTGKLFRKYLKLKDAC